MDIGQRDFSTHPYFFYLTALRRLNNMMFESTKTVFGTSFICRARLMKSYHHLFFLPPLNTSRWVWITTFLILFKNLTIVFPRINGITEYHLVVSWTEREISVKQAIRQQIANIWYEGLVIWYYPYKNQPDVRKSWESSWEHTFSLSKQLAQRKY